MAKAATAKRSPKRVSRQKYGLIWDDHDDLQIEMDMIRRGGYWTVEGQQCGLGLFEHFMRARELVWPDRYRHRWTDLIYNSILDNIVTILMGSGSSQKTSHAAEFVLLDYWANYQNTLVIVSTTTVDKLDLAVFGEITMLHKAGQDRWPWLPGHKLTSKRAISTDDLEETGSRDIRKGLIGRPCFVGKNYVGLGTYAGVKQQRIRFLADELQFMVSTFFDCLPNMFQSSGLDADGQPEVKIIGSGNPKHDPFDMLSIAAEPDHPQGWDSVAHVEKTAVWKTKFHRGVCVNLIGTDSPNFDPPVTRIPRFPRLISQNTIDLVLKRWKRDSLQFYSQCLGKMVMGMVGNRVITKSLCTENHAFDSAVWMGNEFTHIGFLDPAWGGASADRCVFGWLRFGYTTNGSQQMELMNMEVVPIMAKGADPDEQIAAFVLERAAQNNIEGDHIFYDSTGRGTTGAAFAKVAAREEYAKRFGTRVPVPVAFGDRPSTRPVRHDLFVSEPDGRKRHKRCDEEYGKRVTELWFAVRNVIECDQFRRLTEDVCREGCMREYTLVAGGRIDVETKDETRERMGESPDLFDALAVGVEGARQLGFQTKRVGWEVLEQQEVKDDFFEAEAKQYREMVQGGLLSHTSY